jgi:RNA polymerase sigma-70 factor (ECF subfamily)
MDDSETRALIAEALGGSRVATRRLYELLRPEIVAEIGHRLARVAPTQGRSATQERDDLVQHVFLSLWDKDGELLRRWDPERGRSLASYARLIARSRALDVLRSPTRSPWQIQPLPDEELEGGAEPQAAAQAKVVHARELLDKLQQLLAERFSARDWMLFYALLVDERSPKDVADELGMTTAAVYQWRSRFGRGTLPEIAKALRETSAPNPRSSGPDPGKNGTGSGSGGAALPVPLALSGIEVPTRKTESR